MRILIVSTSHAQLGSSSIPTGLGLETLAEPYYSFVDSGFEVQIASPLGGKPPIDPLSINEETSTEATRRFENDGKAQLDFEKTVRIEDIRFNHQDAIFLAGGHGGMWDFAENKTLAELITKTLKNNKPVAAICHGSAAFCRATNQNGQPLMMGRKFTCLSNSEERLMNRDDKVPFLLEDRLVAHGAKFIRAPDFTSHVVIDGKIITGQNMRSANETSKALVSAI